MRVPQEAFGLRGHGVRPRWFVAGEMGARADVVDDAAGNRVGRSAPGTHCLLGVGTDGEAPELPELAEAGAQLTPTPDVSVCGRTPAMVEAGAEIGRNTGIKDEERILDAVLPDDWA